MWLFLDFKLKIVVFLKMAKVITCFLPSCTISIMCHFMGVWFLWISAQVETRPSAFLMRSASFRCSLSLRNISLLISVSTPERPDVTFRDNCTSAFNPDPPTAPLVTVAPLIRQSAGFLPRGVQAGGFNPPWVSRWAEPLFSSALSGENWILIQIPDGHQRSETFEVSTW